MKKIYLIAIVFTMIFSSINSSYSQTITCKQVYHPTDDAHVPGRQYNTNNINNNNQSFVDYLQGCVWTYSGEPGISRAFLHFNILDSTKTTNATINNVNLYLYNSNVVHCHSKTGTSLPNKLIFNRVISSWQEKTITWNNQPAIDTSLRVESPEFWGTTGVAPENHDDLTINLNKILLNGGKWIPNYKGISFRQYDDRFDARYREITFASHRYKDSIYWPKLEVEYTLPKPNISFDGYNTFQVINNHDLEALFNNVVYKWNVNGNIYYGNSIYSDSASHFDVRLQIIITNNVGNICNYTIDTAFNMAASTITCKQVYHPTDDAHVPGLQYNTNNVNNNNQSFVDYLQGCVWTYSGEPGISRAFLHFNILDSTKTTNTTINNVNLYLYNSNVVHCHSKTGTSLPNKLIFNRVISSWQEKTITWNNQPAIDTSLRVESPEFWGTTGVAPENHDDLTINLNKILLNGGKWLPNYKGISFRQYDDRFDARYREITFASHRYKDSIYWPKLEVEYTLPKPNISFDGYNTFQVVNNHDLEALFNNVVYKWNVNGSIYYGNMVMVNLQQNNTIELQITIYNNAGNNCVYSITATLNYSSSALTTLKYISNNIILENGQTQISDIENNLKDSYTIYPNPTSKTIQVKYNSDAQVKEFSIFNSIGVKVKQGSGFEINEIDVSDLSSGLYIMQILNNKNRKATLSFIKK